MTRRFIAAVAFIVLAAQGSVLLGDEAQDAKIRDLTGQVQRLEQRVRELEQLILPMKSELQAKARSVSLHARFEARIERDRIAYSEQELQEIESLYQIANRKWSSPQAQESLKKLVDKYGKANRTGCAVLYLGQMTKGADQEKYLKRAIQDFGDCWYGNGVQVGSYARFLLAACYLQDGRKAEASALFDEIRKDYPEAVDHRGNLLVNMMPK